MPEDFLAAAAGMGRNVAYLLGFYEKGIRPDVITFSDTGSSVANPDLKDGEKPETYAFLEIMSDWCEKHFGCHVERVYKRSRYQSLYDNCWQTRTLPSAAYGLRSCSDKWKIQPQDRFMNSYAPAVAVWNTCFNCGQNKKKGHVAKYVRQSGGSKKLFRFCLPLERQTFFWTTPITKAIGYHAGEQSRIDKVSSQEKYKFWYPLMEWGWFTEDCVAAFKRHDLPVPLKSACYFCPSSTKDEVLWLHQNHPELYDRAVALESNATDLRTVKGLGRHWTWRELVQISPADVAQLPNPPKMNCACFDTED